VTKHFDGCEAARKTRFGNRWRRAAAGHNLVRLFQHRPQQPQQNFHVQFRMRIDETDERPVRRPHGCLQRFGAAAGLEIQHDEPRRLLRFPHSARLNTARRLEQLELAPPFLQDFGRHAVQRQHHFVIGGVKIDQQTHRLARFRKRVLRRVDYADLRHHGAFQQHQRIVAGTHAPEPPQGETAPQQ